MPAALQWFAEVNPITIVVDAMRALWLGAPAGNNVWGAVVWCLVADRDLRAAGRPQVPPDRGLAELAAGAGARPAEVGYPAGGDRVVRTDIGVPQPRT